MVNEIVQYRHFSTLDLKSAYHQGGLPVEDRPYTDFEASGKLYQANGSLSAWQMRFLGSKESWTILFKATGAKVRLLIWITWQRRGENERFSSCSFSFATHSKVQLNI